MFIALSIAVIAGILVVTLALPFCKETLTVRLCGKVQGAILVGRGHVQFYADSADNAPSIHWIRVWGVTASLVFTALAIQSGNTVNESPSALAAAGLYGVLAMLASACMVWFCLSCLTFLPRSRNQAGLKHCGMQGMWFVDHHKPPVAFQQEVAARLADSTHASIIDVTGYEILGKGAGPAGGVLYDTLAMAPGIPIRLLLLHPEAASVDPESKQATVLQTVLHDMSLPSALLRKRINATLAAVDALNVSRAPAARVAVRFYDELPLVKAVLFDGAGMVSPWNPRETSGTFTMFVIGRPAAGHSFHEVYRRMFIRLWAYGTDRDVMPLTCFHTGSTVVRRKQEQTEELVF